MSRVKICGITTVDDALAVTEAGADAIGLVFYDKSPRNISVDEAIQICDALPPFISVVALFMNPSSDFVYDVISAVPCDLLQFHGDESPEFCGSFGRAYIKAVPMSRDGEDSIDFADYADQFSDAKGFLVDSHAPGEAGGSGKTFDWDHIPSDYPSPIILAGGLNPDNVSAALSMAGVYAVDVSSGVESSPGVKDVEKINKFMQEVRSANHND